MSEDLNAIRDDAVKDITADLEGRGYELTNEARGRILEEVERMMCGPVENSQRIASTSDWIEEILLEKKLIKEE